MDPGFANTLTGERFKLALPLYLATSVRGETRGRGMESRASSGKLMWLYKNLHFESLCLFWTPLTKKAVPAIGRIKQNNLISH